MRRSLLVAGVVAGLAGCASDTPLVSRPADAARAVVIRNVRVFDAPRAALARGVHDVIVRDGRIFAIRDASESALADAPADDGLRELDGTGGTLLPGLVDVHTHTGSTADPPGRLAVPDVDGNLAAFLYAGVTTVLDLGSLSPAVFRERADVAAGTRLGPRVYAAGPIFTAPGGHPVEMLTAWLPWYLRWYVIPRATREVATAAEARAAVTALLPERPDILKITVDAETGGVPYLSAETIAGITEAGHAGGIRSIAHIGSAAEARAAVQAGVDALAHLPWRDELPDETVALIAAKRVPVVPTLAVWDLVGEHRCAADYLPIEREVASPELFASLLARGDDGGAFADVRRAAAAGHDARQRNLAKLRAAGVTILAGSDACNPGAIPGAGLHHELSTLVAAGMPAGEALRAATWDNARFLAGADAPFGKVAVGRHADLVLVDGDPTARIEDLGRIRAVVLDGTVLERHPRRSD